MFYRFLKILILLLLTATLIKFVVLPDSNPITLTGFFEFMSNSKSVQIPFLKMSDVQYGEASGCMSGWTNFMNSIKSVINLLVFLVNGLLSVAQYVVDFVRYLYM